MTVVIVSCPASGKTSHCSPTHRQLFRNPSFADRRFPSQPPCDPHFPDIAFAPPSHVRLLPVQLRQFLGNDPAPSPPPTGRFLHRSDAPPLSHAPVPEVLYEIAPPQNTSPAEPLSIVPIVPPHAALPSLPRIATARRCCPWESLSRPAPDPLAARPLFLLWRRKGRVRRRKGRIFAFYILLASLREPERPFANWHCICAAGPADCVRLSSDPLSAR